MHQSQHNVIIVLKLFRRSKITMKHIYQENDPTRPTFVLLHGTGGNERDLIPLAQMIDEKASYLGVLGEVSEHGMPRFFKRLEEGVFDEEDLVYRTNRLHEFLQNFFDENNINKKKVVLLGYSNGANMAQSLLLHYPNTYPYIMMHHPMNVKKQMSFTSNDSANVFIGAGLYDPLCPKQESDLLKERLELANINTTLHFEDAGHELTRNELIIATSWYEKHVL